MPNPSTLAAQEENETPSLLKRYAEEKGLTLRKDDVPVIQVPKQKPSVGRIVHYGNGEGRCLAAIVTEVSPESGKVGLCVFGQSASVYVLEVSYDEGKTPGTWHWPERA